MVTSSFEGAARERLGVSLENLSFRAPETRILSILSRFESGFTLNYTIINRLTVTTAKKECLKPLIPLFRTRGFNSLSDNPL